MYLQHQQKQHLEELKKERAPSLQVQRHLLVRSDRGKSGFKGVYPHKGRYNPAAATTSAPSTSQRRELRRTCSTGRKSIRRSWRKKGPRHSKFKSTFSSDQTIQITVQATRECIQAGGAGTRLNAICGTSF